jgi:hypothetical protein
VLTGSAACEDTHQQLLDVRPKDPSDI